MPNRIIRENILTSVPMSTLAWPEEVFYRRLMSIVDDYGRYEALPQLVRARCYPLQTDQVRVADITRWMAACQKAGLVVLYEAGGKQYLQIEKFGQQRRTDSKFPSPPAIDINCDQAAAGARLYVVGDVDEKGAIAPSSPADADDPPAEDMTCPQQRIRALYAEALPSLPQPKKWDGDRERALRARWTDQAKEKGWKTVDEGLEWFGRFFAAVSENDWAMGRSGRGKGHENWECDIDYLLSAKGFRRIIESAGRERETA